jgi:hypothetical protein
MPSVLGLGGSGGDEAYSDTAKHGNANRRVRRLLASTLSVGASMKLKHLVPPEVEHDRVRCGCRRSRGCWPMTDADIRKQDERWEANEFIDELIVMKRHGRTPGFNLNSIARALSSIMGGPQYEMTYAQRSAFDGLCEYDYRRELVLGIEARTTYELAMRAGFARQKPSRLVEQWNRLSSFAGLLEGAHK